MNVDFQARGQHLARVAVAGMIVHHEILREELQHHAVFLQLHAGGAVHHAVTSRLLDLPHVAQFHHAAAIGAAHGGAAHAHHHGFDRDPRRSFGLAQRGGHGFRDRLLIGDPPFGPALRLDGARAEKRMRLFSRTQTTSRVWRLPASSPAA